ncbi:MAG: biopolymer transporter ExbD [Saprospiraceae bacterium]|nr:biopolymer transporter ExbD [Saprospiraceae bacterium]
MKTERRQQTEVSAGSMADIAFLLLIFFLVATTIDKEQGILIKMPPLEENTAPMPVPEKNIATLLLNGNNQIWLEGEEIKEHEIKSKIKHFILNPNRDPTLPIQPSKTAISLTLDRGATYEKYVALYNEITAAYREMWEKEAQNQFSKEITLLSEPEMKSIKSKIPMVIMEREREE